SGGGRGDYAKPRRRSTSRSTYALVSSLTPLASIFLRSRISLRPKGEGGLPGSGSSSLPVGLAAFAEYRGSGGRRPPRRMPSCPPTAPPPPLRSQVLTFL